MSEKEVHEILFPTDFSAASEPAARVAADLARKTGARLHVIHVAHGHEVAAAFGMLDDLTARLRAEAGVSVVAGVEMGAPASHIVEYAARNAIDVIVMGTHGRTGLSRLLRGSVADAVERMARCHVVTVGSFPPPPTAVEPARPEPPRRCLVCAQPGGGTICDRCARQITAEARERKLRELRAPL